MTSAGNSCGMTTTTGQRQWNGRRVAISVLAVAAIVAGIVVGRHTLAESLQKLAGLDWTWFVAAIACEFISLTAFGLSRRRLLAVVLIAGSVASGASVATAVGFAGAAVLILPAVAILVALRNQRLRRMLSVALARLITVAWRLLRRPPGTAADTLDDILDRVASIRMSWPRYAEVFGLALLNWIGDCACLACAIHAAGQPVPWGGLLLAYAAGAAVGSTGLTPGGFALVEATLTAALVAAGMTTSAALTSVLAYRLVNFWMILIGGWAAMIVLTRVRIRTATSPGSPAGPG